MLFKIIHGAQAVLKVRGGVYKQVDVYAYGRKLFAKNGSGFIALRTEGMTSAPNVTWEHIEGTTYSPGQGQDWGALIVGKSPVEMAA